MKRTILTALTMLALTAGQTVAPQPVDVPIGIEVGVACENKTTFAHCVVNIMVEGEQTPRVYVLTQEILEKINNHYLKTKGFKTM